MLAGAGAAQLRRGLAERRGGPAVPSGEALSPLRPRWVCSSGSRSKAPVTAATMGQCGITSSKTVLVFLNLIFWVSGGRRPGRARGASGEAR